MDSARSAGTSLQAVYEKAAVKAGMQTGSGTEGSARGEKAAPSRVAPSVVTKIRSIGDILDDAQKDVYDELWISLESYPQILEAYLPLLSFYADNAFPDSAVDLKQNAIN